MVIFGINFTHIIQAYGPIAVFLVIFAESALIFFLPGDTFLFIAGILASQHALSFWWAIIAGLVGAILGNNVGYWLGKKFGEFIISSKKLWLIRKEHIDKVQQYYDHYGPLTIILARFIPGIRTAAPIAAGIGTMNYRTFFIYNAGGAILWMFLVITAGYYLGKAIPNIDTYIIPIVIVILVASIIPGLISYWRHKKSLPSS